MGTRSTTTMIAICSAFRRPSGSMRTIDIAAVLHRKEAHEEKTEDHYHGHAGEVFPELARTSIVTDRFVLLSRPSSTHKIISRKIACCSAVFFMPAKKGPVCGRLTSSFLAEAFRPTPVSRKRSTAVSPAGPRSEGSSRNGLPQSLRSIPEPRVRRESGQPQSLQPS